MKTIKLKVSELVEDFDIYPRAAVDSGHVSNMVEAKVAGATFPPIIIDAKTKRIIDGFHRSRMTRRVLGPDAEIECIAKTYKNEKELFLDAMRLNSGHGRNMTRFDRTVAIQKAMRFEIDPDLIASALNMQVDRVTAFKTERCAKLTVTATSKNQSEKRGNHRSNHQLIPLKRPILHMVDQEITQDQADIIPKLGGNHPTFYVNQLIMLIEKDMIDRENETIMKRLAVLQDKLAEFLPVLSH